MNSTRFKLTLVVRKQKIHLYRADTRNTITVQTDFTNDFLLGAQSCEFLTSAVMIRNLATDVANSTSGGWQLMASAAGLFKFHALYRRADVINVLANISKYSVT